MAKALVPSWKAPIRLPESGAAPAPHHLVPTEAQRAEIARALGLEALPSLTADLVVRPWMDGVQVRGRFDAVVGQVCSVSLEPFEEPLSGEIDVRAVPAGSPHATPEPEGEVDLDLGAPDPPDVLDGRTVDLAHYVIEHLALEIDPFPRKPGAEFKYEDPDPIESPFAALRKLKDDKS